MSIEADDLIGTWELVSFEVDDGTGRKDWRPPATGLLIYTDQGVMSVAINGNPEQQGQTAPILFYAGRFELHDDGGQPYVTHHVRQSSDPLRLGLVLRRDLREERDLLQLTGRRPDGMRSWLSWKRWQPEG